MAHEGDDDALAQALRDAEAALAAVKHLGGSVGGEFRAAAQAKVDAARAAYRASWDVPRQWRRAERCRAAADKKVARAVALRDEADAARLAAQARYKEAAAAADAALAAAAQAAEEATALAAQLPRLDDAHGDLPAPDRPQGVGEALALLASLVGAQDGATLAALAAVRAAVAPSGGGGEILRPPSRSRLGTRARDGAASPSRTGRRSRSRGHGPPGAEAAYADVVSAAAAERSAGVRDPGTPTDAA